ncbi:GNAT family N-acetyltransferase [uncultured Roseobacter sp.]|uniref:GNAT family N-acetyltransferase n=1 Tax=uncultured Roseobacter sp. TaxID=114847 RepID=UPI002621A832|nr:GNAT family N-acetyltransferase [uncultured Roseobacter sp.]
MDMQISTEFEAQDRAGVADLYWQAFGHKLGRVMGPDPRALRFLCDVIDPRYALTARDATGRLLGVAGFKTAQGQLVGGTLRQMQEHYGWGGGLWRGLVLSALERPVAADVLLMDGICVAPAARGHGVGTALLQAIKDTARAQGKTGVRLDVIDSNDRARALYERQGFTVRGVEHTGPLRHLFRFESATQMVWRADMA